MTIDEMQKRQEEELIEIGKFSKGTKMFVETFLPRLKTRFGDTEEAKVILFVALEKMKTGLFGDFLMESGASNIIIDEARRAAEEDFGDPVRRL